MAKIQVWLFKTGSFSWNRNSNSDWRSLIEEQILWTLTCQHCTSLAFSNLSSLHQFEFIQVDSSKLQNHSNPDSFTICDCTLIIIIGISKTFNDLNWFIPPVWRTRNKFMLRFGHDRSINSFGCRVLGFWYWIYISLPKQRPEKLSVELFNLNMNENTTWYYTTGYYNDEYQYDFFIDFKNNESIILKVVTILQVNNMVGAFILLVAGEKMTQVLDGDSSFYASKNKAPASVLIMFMSLIFKGFSCYSTVF